MLEELGDVEDVWLVVVSVVDVDLASVVADDSAVVVVGLTMGVSGRMLEEAIAPGAWAPEVVFEEAGMETAADIMELIADAPGVMVAGTRQDVSKL